MCYNYDNFIVDEQTGDKFLKYKLRREERDAILKRNKEWRQLQEEQGKGIRRLTFYYNNGYNHDQLPVITAQQPDELQFFYWGLIPPWVKTRAEADMMRTKTLNAIGEEIWTKNSYREAAKLSHRCLIPATGFFEWREIAPKVNIPHHVMVKDETQPDTLRQYNFGGLYNVWTDPASGEELKTFTLITTAANGLLSYIHNKKQRMPLIISEADEADWLNPNLPVDRVKALIKPYPSKHMIGYTISKLLTTPKINRNVPQVIGPMEWPDVAPFVDGSDFQD